MPDFITRLEVENFDIWLAAHLGNTENRQSHGMVDGPMYRDINNPNAVLIHTHVEHMDRATQWLQSEASNEVAREGTVVRQELYLVREATGSL